MDLLIVEELDIFKVQKVGKQQLQMDKYWSTEIWKDILSGKVLTFSKFTQETTNHTQQLVSLN